MLLAQSSPQIRKERLVSSSLLLNQSIALSIYLSQSSYYYNTHIQFRGVLIL
uniref:Uncharacterized protein n=1 Tax=Physcomitrium patens TaxID=3218 RepID=A0A2K1KXC0_PHYPA|nr:hypothetical protein PHYPA_005404 [Physcomitrium patens]